MIAAGSPRSTTALPAARHAAHAVTPWWRLLVRLMARCQVRYLLDAPATHSWLILMRKYDAFATDFAYDTTPRSWLGPLGHAAARRVMHYPVHAALRERLALIVAALVDAAERQPGEARILSAPCGLSRDILTAAERVRQHGHAATWHGLDLDARGDVLPEARRRAAAAGIPIAFFREDLLDPAGLAARARLSPYDIVNCIGLATWLSLDEVEHLAGHFRAALRPSGTLIIDNWARHEHSQTGEDLEIVGHYHPPAAFRAALERAGFSITREQTTGNGICTVVVASRQSVSGEKAVSAIQST